MDPVYPPTPFSLSPADANALELLADHLVAETLWTHDEFVAQGRIVDLSPWRMVKQKNNLTAYRARKHTPSRFRRERVPSDETEADTKLESETDPSVTLLKDDSDDEFEDEFSHVDTMEENISENARPEHAPMVFCTGVVPGTVEGAAFGFLADTEARSRTRNSGNRDVVADDVRILARIHGPTQGDPFRFLGVKWCFHSTPGAARRFLHPRDYVVLESTGLALDSDGERFCYTLNHTIELDEVPDYRKFSNVRIKFSACHIMKSHESPGKIEICSRDFIDAGGLLAERLTTYIFCDALMIAPQTVEEAYTRKLLWLYRSRRRADSSPPGLESLRISDTCSCCHGKLHTGLAKLLEGATNSMCQLCRHTVCRKCAVKKALPLDIGGPKQLTMQTLDFCLGCYLQAKGLSAWRVAIATMSTSATESKSCDRI
ncbi:hypothetical protein PHYSODRAFT_301327 [Phytophthora sojae]|uniref:FYVE-type domain-containing protein n=1 Tax=Phytophthora sojae (strain P6497) TaxID=1094619 RepID=G4ZJG6_PHYSP|nr:hypothetical protein PHYSODRAFT_301327 [Phytophthora sojae]EGZ18831.1 hypothetical protein PHYSODRAFT_301327 [Phytophthora sojae]|eukprot:XP_009527889.1 hypothetical protein PHYSODRAFT_301327 [Phytophthora sojae]